MSSDLSGFDWIRNGDALIVTDSTELQSILRSRGIATQSLLALTELPKRSLVLSFSKEASRYTFGIARVLSGRKCIFCALHVFDASVLHAEYAIKAIFESDFSASLVQQENLLARLDEANIITVSGGLNKGQASIIPDAVPYAMIMEDVQGDFIHSVAEFFEVHYAHAREEEPCPFTFTGELHVSGILSVIRNESWAFRSELKGALDRLACAVAENGAILKVNDNTIVSFLTAGEEYVDLLALAAGKRGLKLTEFAMGVNKSIVRLIDYRINSQLNEGVEGIHVAIGDGVSGYHIDLLAPQVNLAFSNNHQRCQVHNHQHE